MIGKGSKPRPISVDRKTFDSNWDRIFFKKKDQEDSEKESTLHMTRLEPEFEKAIFDDLESLYEK